MESHVHSHMKIHKGSRLQAARHEEGRPQSELLTWTRIVPVSALSAQPLGQKLPHFFRLAWRLMSEGQPGTRRKVLIQNRQYQSSSWQRSTSYIPYHHYSALNLNPPTNKNSKFTHLLNQHKQTKKKGKKKGSPSNSPATASHTPGSAGDLTPTMRPAVPANLPSCSLRRKDR